MNPGNSHMLENSKDGEAALGTYYILVKGGGKQDLRCEK